VSRRGAALFVLLSVAACGGTSFTAAGGFGDDAGDALELDARADSPGFVVPDAEVLDVHQVVDADAEVLDVHQVVDADAEVLDVHQVVDAIAVDSMCTHSDGMGQSFTTCEAMDRTLAEDACAAFVAATPGAECVTVQLGCVGSGFGVCAQGASSCSCWEYAGPNAGHVHTGSACACAASSDPAWG
jgi:hypothetical protein